MPLPNSTDFTGSNVTERGFKDAQTQLLDYIANEIPLDSLMPLRLKDNGVAGQHYNKAVKSLSLRGDHNGKLISVAIAAYVDGVFTIVLARPDSLSEQMSSSNSKIVARFSGAISFTGVQVLELESYGNTAAEISGSITIDFDQLLQTDSISGSYTASDRLFDSRAIIDLNGEYDKVIEIEAGLVSANANTETVRKYVDISNGIIFTSETGEAVTSKTRFNAAIKSIALKGDYDSKLITLAAFSYTGGNLNIILARPDTTSEVMSSSSNTKYVARFNAAVTFAGTQTLKLESYGNTTAEISGEIVIDFDKLLQTDSLTANYTASERLISKRDIINLNGRYSLASEIRSSLSLITGTDTKNKKLNDAIEELVFFQPLPADKYLNLAGLFYGASDPTLVSMQIFAADDTVSKGSLWLEGKGSLDAEGKALIIFDQGYAKVKMNHYYPTNVGAAVLADNATFETRGINKHFIKRALFDGKVFQRYQNQFVETSKFHLPDDYLKRSLKLAIKGTIADTDYYLLNILNWSLTSGKYRLTYQIKKMTTVDEAVTGGLIVYSGNIEFNSTDDIKGTVTIQLVRANNHPLDAELEVDLTLLKYRTDNNNVYSPMILNKSGTTFANSGFDPAKLRKYSNEKFKSSGGVPKYSTLKDALNSAEKELFAIGGNTFKSRKAVPTSKADFICVNNPPKVLSKKPSKKEYDFYYLGSKIRLEQIDSSDNFYFLNAGFIVKAPHPMKQVWTQVANTSASDFVVYDHQTATHYSIANFTQLFTAAQLTVPTISWLRLTYDDELLIIATDTVRVIMFTENNQTSLRTFNFNGSIGTKYAFGAGVNIIKDWCMSHHKNVMFFSDYDSGVTIEDVNVRGTTGGQKCYVSLDNGYTFTKCFDFTGNDWSNITNASNITAFGASQAHIHAVTYDPKQDVAWIVTGDGAVSNDNSSFFWSRDLGQTWTHMRTTLADTSARSQMIMALPFDGCVAFGSDASNLNGVGVITYNGEQMVHEVAKNFITSTGLYAFARSTWHSQKHGVKYMSFGQDVQRRLEPDAKSFVVASSNGYAWEEVWSDYSDDIYGNVYCYDDIDGKLYISLDGSASYKERVVLIHPSYV